jgi:putative copper resistance protein D
MIDLGLIIVRFLHYAATTTLAGVSFFPIYACAGAEPETLARWRKKLLLAAAVVALLSGLGWFAFAVANMSGALADLGDSEVVLSVMRDTGFGIVWTVRMIIAVAMVVAATMQVSSRATVGQDLITSFLAAGLLASLAGVGHSQIEEGWASVLHVTADAAHLVAAGAWLGGLAPLGFILLGYARTKPEAGSWDVDGVLLRFSGMGYAAVATLVGTGLVNSWLLVGSVSGLLQTSYGRILLGKLVFFAGMLALAAANRFWLVPGMEAARTAGPGGRELWRSRLRTHVLGEQALGLLVLLSVSVLGTIRPAIGQ